MSVYQFIPVPLHARLSAAMACVTNRSAADARRECVVVLRIVERVQE
jgi:hypothetical protein